MKELKEIMESYNSYLLNIPTGVLYIANCLREDNLNFAFTGIKDFSEGVLWLSDASNLIKQNGAWADLNIVQIQEFLIEVNEGLEKQDYLLVADMFEYEIAPFFEKVTLAEEKVR